jgi:hypothetical protein
MAQVMHSLWTIHYGAKRIAFTPRRNIGAWVGLKKSWDHPVYSDDLFRGSILLSIGCTFLRLNANTWKTSADSLSALATSAHSER